jgi:hypothetical protein
VDVRPNWREKPGTTDDWQRRSALGQVMSLLFIEPCLPTVSRTVPTGPQWVYEIKHDELGAT